MTRDIDRRTFVSNSAAAGVGMTAVAGLPKIRLDAAPSDQIAKSDPR